MDQKFEAHRINKPIQLLAAWLVGLTFVNTSFLTTASIIADPPWIRIALVVAAIVNVPVFISCIFLLQTKFRPEMQEDNFYSEHLKRKYNSITGKTEVYSQETLELKSEIKDMIANYIKLNKTVTELKGKLLLQVCGDSFTNSGDQLVESVGDRKTPTKYSWDDIRIEINDLVPQYKNIRELLKAHGIKISNTFGKSSEDKKIPEKLVLSIGLNIPMRNIQEMISILKDHGLDSIDYVDYYQDYYDSCISTFYIGSYAYEEEDIDLITLDDNLINTLLDPNIEEDSFFKVLGVDEWEV